jgi:hypothetical protein
VFVALELSRKSWLVATSSPGEARISKRVVTAGDGPGLLALLGKLRETAERRLGRAVRVVVIQEVDGFWVHRLLVDNAIESHVVDAASLAVPGSLAERRHRPGHRQGGQSAATMIQVAWLWIRHQPGSAISQWFARRVGTARGRVRRIAIVAVARKLLVALWRYVTQGVIPEGAVLKA